MATPNIPSIQGIDPQIAKYLSPMKQAIESLLKGDNRAVLASQLGSGFTINRNGSVDFNPVVVPSVTPEINQRIEQLEAAQSDVSTLADELLGTAAFGHLLGEKLSQTAAIKVNVNGHIAGYGVAVYGGAEGPTTSDFIVQADRFSVVLPSPPWLASHAYTLGQYVTPTTTGTNLIYEVTTAGTTGTTEPSWPTVAGNTVSNGSVVFTARAISARVPFIAGLINGVKGVGISGDLLVDGTIQASAIHAGAITTDKLDAGAVTAEKLAANLVLSQAIEIASAGYILSGQTAYDTGTGWWLGNVSGTPKFSIGNSAGNKMTWNGTTLTVVGSVSGALDAGSLVGQVPPSNFDISTLGWTLDSTFSSTDGDTVAWTSGTLYTAAGTAYAIASGNTGNMSVRTYIFLDINVSTTALQLTTTAANAVGPGRILVAVAENDSPSAFFQLFGGTGSFGVSSPTIPSFGPIKNGDFETGDATGWATDASWSLETSTPINGTTSAKITTSSTGARTSSFPAAPGDRFLITCVASRNGGSLPDGVLRLEVRYGSGAFSSELATAATGTSGTQFLRIIVTVPNGETSAQVVLRKSAGASGSWFADDLFVTPMVRSSDIALSGVTGTIDLATQISGTLTAAFAAAGLINANVTINANGTLSGAGGGQASLNSLPGTINLGTQVAGTLTTTFAAAGLINSNVTINADGTLSGAGSGQASLNSLPGAISAGQINANAVTTAALAAGAVTAGKIFAGTITANEIAASTITGNRIAANTITGGNIVALSITSAELAASSVTAGKVAAGAITANEIAANTITSGQIAANTIVASNIAASSITGSRIAAQTITGGNIAAGTIVAANIAAGTLTANEIAANAIAANQIASGAVTATKLAATLLYAGNIIIDVGGYIRSGQSDYNTGAGWFLGYNGGVPKFSIGNPASTYLTWDGSQLVINGNVQMTQAETPFSLVFDAGWNGTAPNSGVFYYRRSGNIVWVRVGTGCYANANNGGPAFNFHGWPAEILPSSDRQMVVTVFNSGTLQPATMTVAPSGFGACITYTGSQNFNGSGFKGFPDGMVFHYTL